MNKYSYSNSPAKEMKPAKDGDLPSLSSDKDIAAEGANGYNLLEMGVEGFGQDPDNYMESGGAPNKPSKSMKDVIDILVDLGDIADVHDNNQFANFADYLLLKYAETKEEDPAMLFNQLIIKILNADLPDTNEMIKKLTRIYSRTILLEYSKHDDLLKAKLSAYKKLVHRADQYMAV